MSVFALRCNSIKRHAAYGGLQFALLCHTLIDSHYVGKDNVIFGIDVSRACVVLNFGIKLNKWNCIHLCTCMLLVTGASSLSTALEAPCQQ